MPTTSQRSKRTSSKTGTSPQSRPLKSIRLRVTVTGADGAKLGRLAAEKGLSVETKRGSTTIAITAKTPEDALAQLGLISASLASKS